jgi:hypothetical protein
MPLLDLYGESASDTVFTLCRYTAAHQFDHSFRYRQTQPGSDNLPVGFHIHLDIVAEKISDIFLFYANACVLDNKGQPISIIFAFALNSELHRPFYRVFKGVC